MVMAAVGSRKQPTNSISRLASSKNCQGSSVTLNTHVLMAAVTPVEVSSQPKMLAAATMNKTVAVVSTVSKQIFKNNLKFRVRYQTKPKIKAQTHAAIAPSVGVNTPVLMPPISSTGVMMGSSAWNLNNLSAANSNSNPTTTVTCGFVPTAVTSHQMHTGQASTTQVSSKAFKKVGQCS